MPTTSQVGTVLSADNSQYKSVMNESVQAAEKAGKGIFKGLDMRHAMTAIAMAIGFNINDIAENLARRIIGFSKEQQEALDEVVRASEKAAEEQEAARKKAQDARAKEIEEAAKLEIDQFKMIADFRQKTRDDDAESERKYRQKLYDYQQTQDEKHVQAVRDNLELMKLQAKSSSGLTDEEAKRLKVLTLIVKQRAIEEEVVSLLSLKVRTIPEEARLQELLSQSDAIKSQLAALEGVKGKTEEVLAGEKKITAEKQKQNILTVGRGDKELTDAELERKVANIRQDIFASQAGGQYGIGQNLFLEAQKNNLAQTMGEVNLRNKVRREASSFGEEWAFKNNPGISESRFKEIIQGIDTTTQGKIAHQLEELNKSLKAGIPTVFTGGTS